jgi:hypothetical protein
VPTDDLHATTGELTNTGSTHYDNQRDLEQQNDCACSRITTASRRPPTSRQLRSHGSRDDDRTFSKTLRSDGLGDRLGNRLAWCLLLPVVIRRAVAERATTAKLRSRPRPQVTGGSPQGRLRLRGGDLLGPRRFSVIGLTTSHSGPTRAASSPHPSTPHPRTTTGHRLNRSGSRRLNHALGVIAICQIRSPGEGRTTTGANEPPTSHRWKYSDANGP